MCGISGVIQTNFDYLDQSISSMVHRMNDRIVHRGPDADGKYQYDSGHLAMRRLSIIDVNNGGQPIWNEDRTICVFMNGEIYNFKTLRDQLQAKGHIFKTDSDTEILVHLYEEKGDSFVTELKGMFAFCIYDLKKKKYLLARDRFGEKPLYYHVENDIFSYASEMGALLEDTTIPRILDQHALAYYLAGGYVPGNLTLVKNVKTLEPGKLLMIQHNKVHIESYFEIDYLPPSACISDVSSATALIKPLLQQSVQEQLVSDVPIGAFLSGGIDSSTVCAMAQQSMNKKLDTFTVRFEEQSYNESKIAKKVSQHIGSQHHEITVQNQTFTEEIFWKIIEHNGLPFPDSSAIPMYLLSREIRKYVKVALSGDGGDEMFGGYSDLDWWRKIQSIQKTPKLVRSIGIRLLKNLPIINEDKKRKFTRALKTSFYPEKELSQQIHRFHFDDELNNLLKNQPSEFELWNSYPSNFNKWTSLRKAMYFRIKHKMVNDMLIKVDRMSMANSLEVRAPFLDHKLFESSIRLADQLLWSKNGGKEIIRRMMKNELPQEVFDHPKSGFSIPLHKYENEAYHNLVDKLITKESPIYDLFNEDVLKATVQKNRNSDGISTFRLSHQKWSLVQLFGWVKRYNIQVA